MLVHSLLDCCWFFAGQRPVCLSFPYSQRPEFHANKIDNKWNHTRFLPFLGPGPVPRLHTPLSLFSSLHKQEAKQFSSFCITYIECLWTPFTTLSRRCYRRIWPQFWLQSSRNTMYALCKIFEVTTLYMCVGVCVCVCVWDCRGTGSELRTYQMILVLLFSYCCMCKCHREFT